jgi:hypothetical protein
MFFDLVLDLFRANTHYINMTNKQLKLDIALASESIRNKFKQLHNERNDTVRLLEEKYEPVIRKLNVLIDSNDSRSKPTHSPTRTKKKMLKRKKSPLGDVIINNEMDASPDLSSIAMSDFEELTDTDENVNKKKKKPSNYTKIWNT